MVNENLESLINVLGKYRKVQEETFSETLKDWPTSLNDPSVYRVVGGLAARQVMMSIQVVGNFGLWNGHVAPILLRPMLETYLKIAWILQDPVPRCIGIARADLIGGLDKLGKIKEAAAETFSTEDAEQISEPMVRLLKGELDRFDENQKPILLESREMARKAGGQALKMYRSYQVSLSSAVHSTWNHLARFNLNYDPNPLHRYQLIPMYPEIGVDAMYAIAAADFCDVTFGALTGRDPSEPGLPMNTLLSDLEKIGVIRRTGESETK